MEQEEQNRGYQYSYLTSEIDSAYHTAALKCGVSDSAMRILYTICLHGDHCALSEIVHLSGISKQTINSSLRKLEMENVVYLEHVGKKRKMVYLTSHGKQIAANSALRILEIEKNIFLSWSQADRETYISLLERFLSAFKEKVEELNHEDHHNQP
jgi:DNA-binding MarR family transcriptional regulator